MAKKIKRTLPRAKYTVSLKRFSIKDLRLAREYAKEKNMVVKLEGATVYDPAWGSSKRAVEFVKEWWRVHDHASYMPCNCIEEKTNKKR